MKRWFWLLVFSLLIAKTSFAASATAVIEGTSGDSEIFGWASFEDTEEGLLIEAEIFGAPEGRHGFHIHEVGSCEDSGNAAGGHFNPKGHDHGSVVDDGLEKAHAGDLGNIEINEEGDGFLELVLPGLSVETAPFNVGGRALILHEREDDFSQPTGNAGSRIACGLIEIDEEI